MQKISYVIILILIFSMLTPVLFLNDTVRASGGVILLTNWDDVASGLDEGISGYFNFTNVDEADCFETSTVQDLTAPNSFKCSKANGNEDVAGYWNLTTNFEYIYQINFSFVNTATTQAVQYHMYFYDSDDNKVIDIYWNNDDIWWEDVSAGNVNLYASVASSARYYVVITHTGTNNFQIQVLNSAFSVVSTDNQAGSYSGTWTNFSYIHLDAEGVGGATLSLYFDNFYIDLTPDDFEIGDYEGGRCTNPIGGYDMIFEIDADCEPNWICMLACQPFRTLVNCIDSCMDCNWVMDPAQYIEHETETSYCENIRHVLLPVSIDQLNEVSDDPGDYYLIVNDEYVGAGDYIYPYENGYAIVWADVNIEVDGKILFSFYSKEHTSGFSKDWYWYGLAGYYGGWGSTKVHNSISNFYDGILSGTYPGNFKLSCCWYYNETCNVSEDPWKLPIINEFDETFGSGDTGEGYIEFLGYDETCYYKINKDLHTPTVVYNLSGFGAGNGTKTYLFQINKVRNGTVDQIVYNGFIEVANRDYLRDVRELHDFSFEDYGAGQYYIMCYNTSSYGTVIEEFAHRSYTITVCPEETTGQPITEEYYGLPYWVPWIIGIFITLFVTMSPYIVAVYISRKTRATELPRIPGLLYVGFFFMGLTISVLMELLPSWLPFVILFGMVVYFAVTWIYGKKAESTGGD